MTADFGDDLNNDAVELRQQLEELRRENEALKSRGTEEGASTTGGWRRGIASAMVVLGLLVLIAATAAVWLNRQVMDTDTYVQTVAPLAEDTDIQAEVADFATESLFARVDAEKVVTDALPQQADLLAPSIVNSLEGLVRTQANNLLDTEQFSEIWVEANRAAHERLVGALTGQGDGAVQVEGGKVTLNLGDVLGGLQTRLDNSGVEVFNNVKLGNAEFTILESSAVAQAQETIALLNSLALWLPILAFGLLGGAIWLSPSRRRTILWVGFGIALSMVALRIGLDFGRGSFLDATTDAGISQAAAASFFDILTRSLLTAGRTIFAIGLLIGIGAVLAGPSTWAVRLRQSLKGGIAGVSEQFDFGAPGLWINTHKRGLRIFGVVVALTALFVVDRITTGVLGVTVVLLMLYLALIEFFGHEATAPELRATEPATEEEKKRPAA